MILEYFEELKSQIGFYFIILKITFYFIIGALIIYLLKKLKNIFSFFFRFLKKDSLKKNIYLIFQSIMFIIISTFIGWFVIFYILDETFFEYFSTFLIAFSYTFLIRNHVYFGIALGTGTLILYY